MTNPIKKFLQLVKSLVLFPLNFLLNRRVEKIRNVSYDPKARKKLLAELGLSEEMFPLFNPRSQQRMPGEKLEEVDLFYLDEAEGEENEEEDNVDD